MRHSSCMPRSVRPDPPGLPLVVSRPEALRAGMTEDEIRHRVRSGRWSVVTAGIYQREPLIADDPFATARLQHTAEVLAVAQRFTDSSVAFGSAALVHGMAVVSGVPKYRELVVPPGRWNGVRAGTRVRVAQLGPGDGITVGGVTVTSPARTWVDVSRTGGLADALGAGDSALRLGLLTTEDLAAALEAHPATRGLRTPAQALPLLSPLRETALESKSFATFVRWGLPLPECQVEIWGAGRFIARVDFLWRHAGVVGEADGRLKYAEPGALYAEKQREDELRAEGHQVVRWGWHGLDDGLRRRLCRLLSVG